MRLTPLAALALLVAGASAAQETTPASNPAVHQVLLTSEALQWMPAPPALPAGAQVAVLEGNPGESGPFTLRLRIPDGYRVAPHTHPTAERVTVLSGHFMVGMGSQVVHDQMQSLMAGGFAVIPPNMQHYAMAHGETIVQVSGMGPFTLNYVNPADDPRNH